MSLRRRVMGQESGLEPPPSVYGTSMWIPNGAELDIGFPFNTVYKYSFRVNSTSAGAWATICSGALKTGKDYFALTTWNRNSFIEAVLGRLYLRSKNMGTFCTISPATASTRSNMASAGNDSIIYALANFDLQTLTFYSDDSTMLSDLKPCLDPRGSPAFYDSVRGIYVRNTGSGQMELRGVTT